MSLLVGEALSFFGALADSVAGVPPEQTERARRMCATLGRLLELQGAELRTLDAAAVLRNAGIFATEDEYERPASGARICEKLTGLPAGISDIVRWQCEFWDGMGYPDRLRAAEIPRSCSILSVACRYAACVDDQEAHALITGESGRMFAPEATAAFVTWFYTRTLIVAPSTLDDLEWMHGLDAQNVLGVLTSELQARFGTNPSAVREHAAPLLGRFASVAPMSRLFNEDNA